MAFVSWETFVKDRVLHVTYFCRQIPLELDDLGTIYEGYVPNRIGVNLPMKVLKDLMPKNRLCIHDADYIICYPSWDRNYTMRHELLHAKFYMDDTYRKRIQREWEELSKVDREKISKKLFSLGYKEEVHCDEWQAYQKVIP